MDATISSSLNADPSTIPDVRSWPTPNSSGRCSERHTGSLLKNRDKITPRKRTRPTHTDAFNVLIKNLKEKNPIWGRTTLDCERSVTRTLFMKENSDGDLETA